MLAKIVRAIALAMLVMAGMSMVIAVVGLAWFGVWAVGLAPLPNVYVLIVIAAIVVIYVYLRYRPPFDLDAPLAHLRRRS
jgi:hypothetical protein